MIRKESRPYTDPETVVVVLNVVFVRPDIVLGLHIECLHLQLHLRGYPVGEAEVKVAVIKIFESGIEKSRFPAQLSGEEECNLVTYDRTADAPESALISLITVIVDAAPVSVGRYKVFLPFLIPAGK